MRCNSMRMSHFFTALLALTACGAQQGATTDAGDDGAPAGASSSSGSPGSTSSSGGGSSSGGAASSSGAGTSGSASSSSSGAGTGDGSSPIMGSLAGTWDLVGATPGAVPQMGTMVLGANVLTLTFIDVVLDFRGSGSSYTATYTHYSAAHVAAQVASAPLDMGIFPLVLGGSWTFTDANGSPERCTASLQPSAMTARCTSVTGWYSPLAGLVPQPIDGDTYTATRTAQLASDFGDLGGVWQTSDALGGGAGCTVTIQNNVFSSRCSGIYQWGSVTATFVNGSMVSGTTGSGVEFTAQKR